MKKQNILFLFFFILTIFFILNFTLKRDLDKAFMSYENGDTKKALNQFGLLCDKKNAQACYYKALIHVKKQYFATTEENIKKLFEKSCNLGYSSACFSLAKKFFQNDINKSTQLYSKACNLKDYESCYEVGRINLYALNANTNESYKYFELACKNKYAKACFEIGKLYYDKNITIKQTKNDFIFSLEKMYNNIVKPQHDKSLTNALSYFQKSCNLRYAKACFLLANMYKEARGTQKDLKISFKLYRRSCNWGYQKACEKLSLIMYQ